MTARSIAFKGCRSLRRVPSPLTLQVADGDVRELRFDLRSPCRDCPFRLDVAHHQGVACDLVKLGEAAFDGSFIHSCHKTDPRSDCETAKDHTGPVQHCAGSMIMLLKSRLPSRLMRRAALLGLLRQDRLNMAAPVGDLATLGKHYIPYIEKLAVLEDGDG